MKNQILNMLASAEGYVSGEQISEALGVSRTAVWKHIKKLKDEGFLIESSTKKGYRLLQKETLLLVSEIQRQLDTQKIGKKIYLFDQIDSTNEEAKRHWQEADGTVFLADFQTRGKGRVGRLWESARGEGVWMTVLLKPELLPAQVSQVTLLAGLAVVQALSDENAMIKWPNDVVINGKKICGILTEISAEINRIEYMVCGIGINVNVQSFPDVLKNKATSLYMEHCQTKYDRNEIIAKTLNAFEPLYHTFLKEGFTGIKTEYKRRCVNIGREVQLLFQKEQLRGVCVDVDDDGALVVDTKERGQVRVNAGEVSVRGIYGYI